LTVNFSRTPGIAKPGTSLGQHTDSLLAEIGYTDSEISELRATGVVA
jgi:crotonobetainyl-CoA:carnitine CoA-transferase CaiB-like acyl-CoA transferase